VSGRTAYHRRFTGRRAGPATIRTRAKTPRYRARERRRVRAAFSLENAWRAPTFLSGPDRAANPRRRVLSHHRPNRSGV